MLPHRIRLRGPWEAAIEGSPPRTIHLDRDDLPTSWSGAIEWRRSFGQPRQLDAHERIWLCLHRPRSLALIALNDAPLGTASAQELWETDITDQLAARNRLKIVQPRDPRGWSDVFLEIRAIAYIQNLHVVRRDVSTASAELRGIIRGPTGLSLDLYVLADRSCVARQTITLTDQTTSFQLSLPAGSARTDAAGCRWRVELVSGPTLWHVAEISPT